MNKSTDLSERLQFNNISCLRAAGAVNDIEGNILSFVKGFKTITLNSGKMHEYILAAISFNETKTLFCVKPFYFAVHVVPPKKLLSSISIAQLILKYKGKSNIFQKIFFAAKFCHNFIKNVNLACFLL